MGLFSTLVGDHKGTSGAVTFLIIHLVLDWVVESIWEFLLDIFALDDVIFGREMIFPPEPIVAWQTGKRR